LKQGLVDKSSDSILFSSQCRSNINILRACSEINSRNPKPRFAEAVVAFNNDCNADVRAILRFIPDFNKIIGETQLLPVLKQLPDPVLGKRKEPEKQNSIVASLIKYEVPMKCIAAHASSLVREELDEVDCDLCPEPKKKNAKKPLIKPSWYCSTCEFDFCQSCSAMPR